MNEKVMVADTLAGINGELTRYGEMIPQTENPQLKQTLKQMRNQCEMSGGDLPDCPCKRLLCAGSSGNKGRSGSCQKRA